MRPNTTPCFAPDGSAGGPPPQDPNRFAGIRRDYTEADVAKIWSGNVLRVLAASEAEAERQKVAGS
jgi:hypothetical protein